MALENMKDMLWKAKANKYAVGAFNILDYNSMLAVAEAAEELKSPVIIQTSAKTVVFWGVAAIGAWYKDIAERVSVPAALHLDHCQDIGLIEECIEAGWTSVMIDASSKPFEENMEITSKVIMIAEGKDVSVEAELGRIGGVEDDLSVDDRDASLADPALVEKFCEALSLDCFAPAVGTAHGVYKGEPKIAFELIEKISNQTDVPLALHGGTGLSDEVFRKIIALGCAKVNISTQIKYDFIDSFVNYHNQHNVEYNPLKVIDSQCKHIKRSVMEKIRLFGSSGQS